MKVYIVKAPQGEDLEVVGTVWDNPELLEASNED